MTTEAVQVPAPAGVDFSAVANAIADKVKGETSELHAIAKAYKARNGSVPELDKWIAESEDESVIARREAIAAAEEKIKEMRKALHDEARAAIVDPDFDPETIAKEFKARRTAVKTLILQSKGTLESFGQEAEFLTDYLDNLPNITGGVSASGRSPEEMDAIREWARENDFEVKDRGRLSKKVLDAYDAKDKPASE